MKWDVRAWTGLISDLIFSTILPEIRVFLIPRRNEQDIIKNVS
jgi:hypothetical protein